MAGFLDALAMGDGLSVPSSKHHKRSSSRSRRKHRSRSRSSSRSRGNGIASFFGVDSSYKKHNTSRGSFFGLGEDSSYSKHNASRGSFFNLGNMSRGSFFGSSRPSYYKRSPRQGFMARAYKKVKRLFRDLVHYAKRHPWKVFFLVIMPLVTTGALGALLARFGLRIPAGLERMLGMASRAASGDGFGLARDAMRMAGEFGGSASGVRVERGRDSDGMSWEKRDAFSSSGGGDGWGDSIMGVAKMFI